MLSKRLGRQIKKSFGDEDYSQNLLNFVTENLSQFSDPQKEIFSPLTNIEEFIALVEQSYTEDQALLARAQKNLETSSEELAQTNKDLFKTNKIIEQMLNSLDQGFVIFDKGLSCLSLYTQATIEMLGQEVEGKLIQDILPFDKEESKNSFLDWCELAFLDMHEFETLQSLAPKRLVHPQSCKTLDLDFKTVRDEENNLLFITLILTDKTQEIINQNNANTMQEYAQMVSKVIVDKKTANDYLAQIKRLLTDLREALEDSQIDDKKVVIIKRLLHTIKGAGNTYYFGDLGRRINEIELKLNGMESHDEMFKLIRSEEKNLNGFFESYAKSISDLTAAENDSSCSSEKNKEWVLSLIKDSQSISVTKENVLESLYEKIILSPVHDYITPYHLTVNDLAKRLGKPMPEFIVTGENVRIDQSAYTGFFGELVHLFRNIMDHGLEFEGERITRKKKTEGAIHIQTETLLNASGDKKLKFVISDDGNGIDPQRIKNKLLQSDKYKNNAEKFTDAELINFIFDHGFSTADKKTDISGQGVGMDALKNAVDKMNGTITVDSKLGNGTTFTILLPLKK